ncbi:MAG: glycine betaine ABC transporter substrate-binding protein [Balneolaceae bacterium]|nr:glycine betaine ABC transporter substrate-binding protein [Balneolaceae bacterium]
MLCCLSRNTYAGIDEVDAAVVESARGMGMTDNQVLQKVELPLAAPVIFAGIRTATVINVGVATLCALIGAGGLGEFIFRGIALNNGVMIMAGALPAALLAIIFDKSLEMIERNMHQILKPLAYGMGVLLIFAAVWSGFSLLADKEFKAGVPPEFLERPDGYSGLEAHYNLDIPTVEMNASLMYEALANKRVDVIVGYSTDGRIKALDLKVLKDDRNYFPPYDCSPLIRAEVLESHPGLREVINKLAGKISTQKMTELNNRVDFDREKESIVAKDFLEAQGFATGVSRSGDADILIGGKLQTEHFILAHMYKILIENYTQLNAELRTGLAGTQIAFNALINEEISFYPEYTGTGLHVLLDADSVVTQGLNNRSDAVYDYVKKELKFIHELILMPPLGFENTYALMMRREHAEELGIETISDLALFLNNR